MKRLLDIIVALLGLLLLFVPGLLAAVIIKMTSAGPVFFRQERVGRRFRPFRICKFRTMVQDAPRQGGQITCGDDRRITRIGRILRGTKIDELPQLINVLKGEMSLVGPRPEVPRYVEMFRADYAEILEVRPGITDLASIKYRDETAILGQADGPRERVRDPHPARKNPFGQAVCPAAVAGAGYRDHLQNAAGANMPPPAIPGRLPARHTGPRKTDRPKETE